MDSKRGLRKVNKAIEEYNRQMYVLGEEGEKLEAWGRKDGGELYIRNNKSNKNIYKKKIERSDIENAYNTNRSKSRDITVTTMDGDTFKVTNASEESIEKYKKNPLIKSVK